MPEHRIVATATRDLFWGFSAAAKVELSTPESAAFIYGCPNVCNNVGSTTLFGSRPPSAFLGYKDVDIQITKDFPIYRASTGYIRFDVLNVFNFHNYTRSPSLSPIPPLQARPSTTGADRSLACRSP